MAATGNYSPRNSSCSGDPPAAVNSPQSKTHGLVSPWKQVVRAGEAEPIVSSSASNAVGAPPSPSASLVARGQINNSSPDRSPSKAAAAAADSSTSSFHSPDNSTADTQLENSDNGTGSSNAAKKPAWNKPSNGAVEAGPVMGALSWPALSESTKASLKSSSSDSLKALSDGSVHASQGAGVPTSTSPKPVITNNPNPSSTPNHATPLPTRPKSMKRGGGSSSGNATANGGYSQPSPPLVETTQNSGGKSGPAVPESFSSSRDPIHKESGQRGGSFGSQSNSGNDQPHQPRISFRRGNGSPHPRGDGSHRHNYGGRRDQELGNHEWNSHNRNFNGRDAHMQPPRVFPRGPGFMRHPPPPPPPPHNAASFIPPPLHVRPFGNHMIYPSGPDMASPVMYVQGLPPDLRGVPMVTPMQPATMFYALQDPQLLTKIMNQIDYYFSNENLIKDTFLRQNMDDQGWVPIKLIAGFKKVMLLTDNIQLILDALRSSNVVEVQGDKVRKRELWSRWIMPPSAQFATVSSPQPLGRSNYDMLAVNMQNVSLDEKASELNHPEASLSGRSSSGDLNVATVQAGSEHAILARSLSK
ncbi:hypothetical protein NMG60_11007811 [Bertholletia excelsa]